jgi:hypothetical protein
VFHFLSTKELSFRVLLIAEVLAAAVLTHGYLRTRNMCLICARVTGSLAILAALAYPEIQVLGSDISARSA